LLRGVVERVFLRKVDGEYIRDGGPIDHIFEDTLSDFRDAVFKYVKHVSPIQRDSFPLLYSGRKRSVYVKAVESLQVRRVSRKDSFIQAFVKAEKLDLDSKSDPVPRIIQPRSPRYNVEVGRYLKPLEKRMYKAVNKIFGAPVVAKGLNALSRGRLLRSHWDKFFDPVAVGLDASRFDQSVSVGALEWEHSVYNKCCQSSELVKLLKWQLNNKGFGRCKDGWVKYEVPGSRMSGDMNTSLGNVLIMCAMFRRYFDEKSLKAGFVNDGDDCVVIVERSDLGMFEDVVPWFQRYGFTMKREVDVDVFEKISFCQSSPVYTAKGWVMVRDPRITMTKDSFWLKPLANEKQWKRQRAALAVCGQRLTDGVPVARAWYDMLGCGLTNSGADIDYSRSGMENLAEGMTDENSVILPETRASFFRAFDITPDRQEAIETSLVATRHEWTVPVEARAAPRAPYLHFQ